MGVLQNIGKMTGAAKASSLRTPFVAALVVLIVIWSMLSLDMTSVKAPSMDPTPVYNESPEPDIPIDSKDALRIASEAAALAAQYTEAPVVEETPEVVEVVPTPTPAPERKKPEEISVAPEEAEKGGHPEDPSKSSPSSSTHKPTDRPLILYAYSESQSARTNIEFFIEHALHDAADFVFILNGETDITSIIPNKPNIRYVNRANDCYDLGAYAEVLLADDFYKGYKRFITMNASIRGPFVPYWSNSCWSDIYLNKVTDQVKLVGMTANCWPTFHIQSMIWATDIIGLETLLHPPDTALTYLHDHPITLPPAGQSDDPETDNRHQAPGINGCFHNWNSAVAAEVSSSALIKAAGYKIDAMMNAFLGDEKYRDQESCESNGDVLWDGGYWGTNVNVFETIFIKSNRDVDPKNVEMQTKWMDGREYSSYDYCKL